MHVTLHGDAKKAQPRKEGYYILQTDLVNGRPCWFQDSSFGNAIWRRKNGFWNIGNKEELRSNSPGDIFSSDDVEDPSEALTWKYWADGYIKSKDILVTRPGNIYIINICFLVL